MEFSKKYHEEAFPEGYASKHGESVARRLNDRREQALLARCLKQAEQAAGRLNSIADIGCGPGRFWPTIHAAGSADLYGSDVSESMLRYARDRFDPAVGDRFALASGTVTALPFAEGAFDCVISMRLLHHFGDADERQLAISELTRVAGRFLIVSLWTDGNYKAWRRARLERRRGKRAYQNRFVVPRETLESEFRRCGLEKINSYDLIPGYSQWRFYLLEKTGSTA